MSNSQVPDYSTALADVRRAAHIAAAIVGALIALGIVFQLLGFAHLNHRLDRTDQFVSQICTSRNASNEATGRLLTGLRTVETKPTIVHLYDDALRAYDHEHIDCSKAPK